MGWPVYSVKMLHFLVILTFSCIIRQDNFLEKTNRRPHVSSISFIEIRKRKHHICWFNPISTIMPGSALKVDNNILAVFLSE